MTYVNNFFFNFFQNDRKPLKILGAAGVKSWAIFQIERDNFGRKTTGATAKLPVYI